MLKPARAEASRTVRGADRTTMMGSGHSSKDSVCGLLPNRQSLQDGIPAESGHAARPFLQCRAARAARPEAYLTVPPSFLPPPKRPSSFLPNATTTSTSGISSFFSPSSNAPSLANKPALAAMPPPIRVAMP